MFANVFMLTVEQERLCTMELMTKNIELPMGELGIFIQELGPGEEGIGITTREVQLTVVVENTGKIGRLSVLPESSMSQVRRDIRLQIGNSAPRSFAFLVDDVPLSKMQERKMRVSELGSTEVLCRAMNSVKSDLFEKTRGRTWTLFGEGEVTVDDVIGSGAFGKVLSGRLYGVSEVAVKKFKHDMFVSEEQQQDFVEEVKMMSGLRHPNIVHFYGAGLDPLCIVMERCEQSLEDLLRNRYPPGKRKRFHGTPFGSWESAEHGHPNSVCSTPSDCPSSDEGAGAAGSSSSGNSSSQLFEHFDREWEWALTLLMSVASGMRYLHDKQICHRDLKSSNILMDRLQCPKISDFGLSRMLRSNLSTFRRTTGTVPWMAPEVIRSEPYSFPVDVYSFAMVVWEIGNAICTRHYSAPFDEYNVEEGCLVFRVGTEFFRPTIPPNFFPPLADLIRCCWSPSPQDRPDFPSIITTLSSMSVRDSPLPGPDGVASGTDADP